MKTATKPSEILTYKRAEEAEKRTINFPAAIILAVIGLLAGRVEVWGVLMPTGVGWAIANRHGKRLLPAIFCCAAGLILSGLDLFKLRTLAALACVYVMHSADEKFFEENTLACAFVGAGVDVICGIIISTVTKSYGFDYIMLIIEGALIIGSAIAFENAVHIIVRGGTILNDDEAISVYVVAACAAAGIGGTQILGVHPSAVLSLYMILLASKKCGAGIAVTLAAVLGAVSGEGDVSGALTLYIFTAIGCSLLANLNRFGIIIGAALANAVFTACNIGSASSWIVTAELTSAVMLFYFTPEAAIDYIMHYTTKKASVSPGKSMLKGQKNAICSAMNEIEGAIDTVAEVVKEMGKGKKSRSTEGDIIRKVKKGVCSGCSLENYCTGKNRKKTEQAVKYITELIAKEGKCSSEQVADVIAWKCIHSEQIIGKVKDSFTFYKEQGLAEKEEELQRRFFVNGLEDMAEIIERRRERIAEGYDTYESLSEEIAGALTRNGVQCGSVCVTKNNAGLFELVAEIESEELGKAEQIICEVSELDMHTVSEEKYKMGTVLTMREREYFKYDVAVLSLDSKERRTGDTAVWFDDGKGSLYCLVGDGMGSGALAAKESGWTAKLFEKLARAGFEPSEAFRIINNVMIAGKENESCISADAAKINLRSGNVEFTKAGAASSYIKTKKGVEKVGWSSLPLGILEISEVQSKNVSVSGGGYVVLMSDGVPDASGDRMEGEHELCRALMQCEDMQPREMAEYLMFASMSMGAPKDDMTIVVAKVIKE